MVVSSPAQAELPPHASQGRLHHAKTGLTAYNGSHIRGDSNLLAKLSAVVGTMNLDSYPHRASHWQLPSRNLVLGRQPLLMGIVNVTPDSFSDGGRFVDAKDAVEHGLSLVEQGADILDIGGESTRPNATPVDLGTELRRTIPVVQRLAEQTDVPISIDTTKAEVARQALAAGAEIVNDICGLAAPGMIEAAAEAQAAVCAMHMQGTPQTMQVNPSYQDVVAEITQYLRQRRSLLRDAGIEESRICLDPGIGFGKTRQHNLTLLANCWKLHELNAPLLVGHSRKGFIGKMVGMQPENVLAGTLGVAVALACQGVQVLRIHDVGAVRSALLMFESTGGLGLP